MTPDARANVLLVDDRTENLVALEAILEPLGQNLVTATSGVEALKELLTRDFAVILLDVQMPDLDGFETAALIKQRQKTRHVPIIFVTAISKDAHHVFRGYSAGAVDYILKPIDPEILRSKVSVFIELYEKGRQLKRQEELLREQELAELRRAGEERYRTLAEAMPQIVWMAGADGAARYYNRRWFEYTGLTPEESAGFGWQRVLYPDDLQPTLDRWAEAVASESAFEIEHRYRGAEGAYRWHLGRALPLRDEDGRITGWVGTSTDIDDQKRTQEGQRFLVEAGAVLGSSLDYRSTLAGVARLAVPRIADWCAIDMVEGDGSLRNIEVAHADPKKVGLARELRRRYPQPPDAAQGPPHVVRTGEAELVAEIPDSLLEAVAVDDLHLRLLRELGLTSYICVPLVARGRTLGAITLVAAESGRSFGPEDLALAEELARRAATAVDNARLFETERRALVEAEATRRRLAAQYAVTRVLAESGTLAAAVPRILRAVCESLDWEVGGVWRVDEEENVLRCLDVWHVPSLEVEEFEAFSRQITFAPGVGLPGRVWASGEPAWIPDVLQDTNFPRAPVAAKDGLHGAFGFPILLGSEVLGVIEFFSREIRQPDEGLLAMIGAIGGQIGQFIERKQAEEAVRESDARKSAIMESALDCVITMDHEGTVTEWNPAAERTFGYARGEALGKEMAELIIPPSLRERHRGGLARYLATGEGPILGKRMEMAGMRADGSEFPVELAITRVDAPGPPSFTGYVRDITERKRAEEERAQLIASEAAARVEAEERAQAAQVLATVGDGVFLIDREGVVRLWNPAAEAITGLRQPDVVGRPATEVIPGWADVAPRVPVASAPGPAGSRAETVPLEIAGRERWLSISGVDFAHGTVYAFRDLTEARAVEEMKSDFVATVSHELRTPLAAIYGAAMTIRRPDVEMDDGLRDRLLDIVAEESDRLAQIVNDLLLASHLDSGQLQVTIESCDAAEIAHSVVEAARAHLPEVISLELTAAKNLPPVAADPAQLRQVLANLVDNAVRYSPDGGPVELKLEREGRQLRFSVRDEGLGIPAPEHRRIFEKFYRVDPQMTRGIGGTGLGLYICRELVRQLEGRVWVESEPGRGSTFFVEIPRAEAARKRKPRRKKAAAST